MPTSQNRDMGHPVFVVVRGDGPGRSGCARCPMHDDETVMHGAPASVAVYVDGWDAHSNGEILW